MSTDKIATVLVVDDDLAIRETVRRALTRHGYAVLDASSTHEATLLIRDAAPDLVIMDLVLPGMGGREGANLLLAHHPDMRVLFISGYTSHESVELGYLREGHPFLRKPFSIDELISAVRRMLD